MSADTTNPMAQQNFAARVAGAAYLVSVAGVIYANFGLRGPLLVTRDPAETIRRIADAQDAFRASVLLDVAYCGGSAIALASLYFVLRDINRYVALLAATLKAVYVGTAVLTALAVYHVSRLAALAGVPGAVPAEEVQSAVRFALAGAHEQYYLGLVFWACATAAFAWLWLRSGYVARWFAVFGIAASLWCAFCAIAYLRDPAFTQTVNLWWFDVPMELFELTLSLLLLVRGLPRPTDARAAIPQAPHQR